MYNRKEGWNQVCFISIRQSIVNLVYLDKAKNASTKALKTTYIPMLSFEMFHKGKHLLSTDKPCIAIWALMNVMKMTMIILT